MQDMESALAREEMAKSASRLLQTKSNFESLRKALVLAQNAEVMAAGLDKREDAPVQLDQEEINHLKGALRCVNQLIIGIS